MSDLSSLEKCKLEKFLAMGNGYVLDFTDRKFQEFILENVAINIDEDKYKCSGTSKANRLREFWKQELNSTVGKATLAMLEIWKVKRLISEQEISLSEQALYDECWQVSQGLIQRGQNDEQTAEVTIDIHFEEIQKVIIEQIDLAKFTIWIAVAWFTDPVLFKKLVDKNNQGVNVQLIIIHDRINESSGLKYEEEFETFRIKKSGLYENLMHNKFCVIDFKAVIHGSYNWTKRAKFNDETIEVVNSSEVAENFSDKFIQLKRTALDGKLIQ
jgi:phosphatidylserine/phosphatidylglycerophosphate/cardiolipin synthase-like enzyme